VLFLVTIVSLVAYLPIPEQTWRLPTPPQARSNGAQDVNAALWLLEGRGRMRFVDAVEVAGWVAAALWVAWLGACLARAWAAADRPPDARPRCGDIWRAQSVRERVLLVGLGAAVWLDVAQLDVVDSVEDHTGLSTADPTITAWFINHRATALTAAAKVVSDAGSTVAMGVLALLGVAWLAWRRRWPQAATVAIAALGAAMIGSVMKHVLNRPRPPRIDQLVVETTASLPSGHALGAIVVLGMLTAIAFGVLREPVTERPWRRSWSPSSPRSGSVASTWARTGQPMC
jgi:hypothetical protein